MGHRFLAYGVTSRVVKGLLQQPYRDTHITNSVELTPYSGCNKSGVTLVARGAYQIVEHDYEQAFH